ncbi:hypothetical protein [Ornithinimicrobium murale]|uniref:hypothetical protein n=1 Tax=Ornithinimicrobium murale TaxID=1050153 RepID=UPI000E0DD0A8|nr:hypothetical protein [Ornithinimicrobium murale]
MSALDSKTRTDLLLAAMNAVGAVAQPTTNSNGAVVASVSETWQHKVEQKAMEILTMGSEGSQFARALDVVATAHDKQIDTSKAFSAVIQSIELHGNSKRVLVTLHAKGADEDETVRTDRTDTGRGALMAREVNALVGHRVMVYIEMERMSNGNKVRILRHLTDLGPNQE